MEVDLDWKSARRCGFVAHFRRVYMYKTHHASRTTFAGSDVLNQCTPADGAIGQISKSKCLRNTTLRRQNWRFRLVWKSARSIFKREAHGAWAKMSQKLGLRTSFGTLQIPPFLLTRAAVPGLRLHLQKTAQWACFLAASQAYWFFTTSTGGQGHSVRLKNRPLSHEMYTTLYYITPDTTRFFWVLFALIFQEPFHYFTVHSPTLRLQLQLHNYTPLQYTPLHSTTLNYTTLHYITLHYTPLHYTTLHYLPLHFTTLHYTTLHYTTTTTTTATTLLHSTTRNYTTLHYITLHYTTFHYTPLHYTS